MTIRKTSAIAVVAIALFVALDGFAQSSTPGFAGSWRRDWPAALDAPSLPFMLRVTMDEQTLAIEERSADTGLRRSPSSYRLVTQAVDPRVSLDRAGRTFRWLPPDRLELHEMLSSGGHRVAVRELWELGDGGRVLRIWRSVRFVEGGTTLENRVSIFQRIEQ